MGIFENRLSEDQLEGVSGGGYLDASGLVTQDQKNLSEPFEVIDDGTGVVLERCKTEQDAIAATGKYKVNHVKYTFDQVQTLRN